MHIKIPTDKEIMNCIGNANFGTANPIALIKHGLLKIACGYAEGHTVTSILIELRLVKKSSYGTYSPGKLTKNGGFVLYEWFGCAAEIAESQPAIIQQAALCSQGT